MFAARGASYFKLTESQAECFRIGISVLMPFSSFSDINFIYNLFDVAFFVLPRYLKSLICFLLSC